MNLHRTLAKGSLAILLLPVLVLGQDSSGPKTPERIVKGNTITSIANPGVVIKVPKSFRHAGADRWNLLDIADCEIHMFVEADRNKVVKRYFWIQFEGYLDSKPEYSYDYHNGTNTKLYGLDFNVRARFGTNEKPKPESDLDHAFAILKKAGYTLPPDLMNVRLVHLIPESNKRKELMTIYAEDMALSGLKFSDFVKDGKIAPKWLEVEPKLIARAIAKLKLTQGH